MNEFYIRGHQLDIIDDDVFCPAFIVGKFLDGKFIECYVDLQDGFLETWYCIEGNYVIDNNKLILYYQNVTECWMKAPENSNIQPFHIIQNSALKHWVDEKYQEWEWLADYYIDPETTRDEIEFLFTHLSSYIMSYKLKKSPEEFKNINSQTNPITRDILINDNKKYFAITGKQDLIDNDDFLIIKANQKQSVQYECLYAKNVNIKAELLDKPFENYFRFENI